MRRHICIENYTVREVLMKNRTRVKFGEIFIIPRVRSTSGITNISANTSFLVPRRYKIISDTSHYIKGLHEVVP
jgi:hypothetical protein